MARKPRIHLEGALYHVMLRGNCGQSIFLANDDREALNMKASSLNLFSFLFSIYKSIYIIKAREKP